MDGSQNGTYCLHVDTALKVGHDSGDTRFEELPPNLSLAYRSKWRFRRAREEAITYVLSMSSRAGCWGNPETPTGAILKDCASEQATSRAGFALDDDGLVVMDSKGRSVQMCEAVVRPRANEGCQKTVSHGRVGAVGAGGG